MSIFKSTHKKITQQVLSELETFFDQKIASAQKDDQVLVDMVKVLKEFTLRGGKRIRPFLTVLAYEYCKKTTSLNESREQPRLSSTENIFKAASSVETHHHYLLNLDDMADRDILRHGGKSLEYFYQTELFQHWKDAEHHGRTFSSIAGALLNSYTWELLSTAGFEPQRVIDAMQVVSDMLFSDTVVGWQIQYFQNNEDIEQSSEERFLKGLEYVTSRYTFIGPLQIGVILSGGTELKTVIEAFQAYGKAVGIAFQIQDDILGMYGDPKEMGKAVGNDIREGKKTLLLQYAYRHGTKKDQEFLAKVIGSPLTEAELKNVQEIVKTTGSLKYSQDLAKREVEKGIEALENLHQTEEIEMLKELAQYMIKREK